MIRLEVDFCWKLGYTEGGAPELKHLESAEQSISSYLREIDWRRIRALAALDGTRYQWKMQQANK